MERFAVIGLGRFGMRLASLLAGMGADVIAVDIRKDLIELIRDRVSLAVCLDATDAQALKSQGIDKVDVAIVGVGTSFEANVLSTVTLKQLGVKRVISRAASHVRAEILSRVGADDIVNPEDESAERWKNRLLAPTILERIELAEEASLVQIQAPASITGKTLEQLDVRKKYNVNIVAIRRTVEETDEQGNVTTRQFVISVPMGDTVISSGDVLVVIGDDASIASFPSA